MDDARKIALSSLVLTLVSLGAFCFAAELEYVSPNQEKALAEEFANAHFTPQIEQKILDRAYTCDMYGVRTRLQVRRGLKLYHLKKDGHDVKNSGAHPISAYTVKDDALTGANDKVEDRIRINSKGQLIAQLAQKPPQTRVLAYSVCTPL